MLQFFVNEKFFYFGIVFVNFFGIVYFYVYYGFGVRIYKYCS